MTDGQHLPDPAARNGAADTAAAAGGGLTRFQLMH